MYILKTNNLDLSRPWIYEFSKTQFCIRISILLQFFKIRQWSIELSMYEYFLCNPFSLMTWWRLSWRHDKPFWTLLARRKIYTTIQHTSLSKTLFLSLVIEILLRKMACKTSNKYWNKCASTASNLKKTEKMIMNEKVISLFSNLEKQLYIFI